MVSDEEKTSTFVLKMLLLGFLLTFVGIIVTIIAAFLKDESTVSGDIIIIIGPIPIILGAGP
jgi:uncharacterized membrane protein